MPMRIVYTDKLRAYMEKMGKRNVIIETYCAHS